MNQLNHLEAWTGLPFSLVLMALLVVVVWNWHRKHAYLLWLAVCLLVLDAAFVLKCDDQSWSSCIGTANLFSVAAWVLAQAMAQRYGLQIRGQWVAIGTVWVGLGAWWFSAPMYMVALAWTCAAILGHLLPVVWSATVQHAAERVLRFVYTTVVLLVAWSPWLLDGQWDAQGHASALLLVGAVALSVSMVACTWCDAWVVPASMRQRDGVTGLLGRPGFEAVCGSVPAAHNVTVVVLCELDYFRRFHEQFGLRASSTVLCHFAQLLQSVVRPRDQVARLGYETFALALRAADLSQARVLVQQIRDAMHEQYWAHKNTRGPVTASFGIVLAGAQEPLDVVVHRADVLLCQAREEGVNRMEIDWAHAY